MKKKTQINPKGAGRNLLYGEETAIAQIRVPKSKMAQFKKLAKELILKRWEKP